MIRRNRVLAFLVVAGVVLTACGNTVKDDTQEVEDTNVSGVKSAVYSVSTLSKNMAMANRPSGILGVFSSIYTSQGVIVATQGAKTGFEAIGKILEGQTQGDTDENFALLREVGSVLQVNIVDEMNRNAQRAKTLDKYTRSLENIISLTERKIQELDALYETQKDETKAKRTVLREKERELKTVLKNQDYGTASALEEEIASLSSEHAEIEIKTEQTKDMMNRFKDLLAIAKKRYQAVTVNKEILVAGLRVIEVPGIEDLNILEKGRSWRKSRGSGIFN